MWIDGISVQFARLVGDRLDLSDGYRSDWAGSEVEGGKAVEVTTGGRVPVGVYGHLHTKDGCVAVGLVHMAKPGAVASTPPTKATTATGPAAPPKATATKGQTAPPVPTKPGTEPVRPVDAPALRPAVETTPPAQPAVEAAAAQPAAQPAKAEEDGSKLALLVVVGLFLVGLVAAAGVAGWVLAGSANRELAEGPTGDVTDDPLAVLPPHLAERVTSELTAGELVVWAAQPSPAVTRRAAIQGIAVTGCGVLVAGVIALGLLGAGGNGTAMGAIFGGFALLFLVAMVLAPRAVFRQAARTCYVLTNRRAIVSVAWLFSEGEIDSYSPAQLQGMQRRDSWWVRGAGDLVFRTRTTVTVTTYRDSPATVREKVTRYGFLGIDNVREVEKLVREALVNPLTDNMIGR
jgi:hypothetical protein